MMEDDVERRSEEHSGERSDPIPGGKRTALYFVFVCEATTMKGLFALRPGFLGGRGGAGGIIVLQFY